MMVEAGFHTIVARLLVALRFVRSEQKYPPKGEERR